MSGSNYLKMSSQQRLSMHLRQDWTDIQGFTKQRIPWRKFMFYENHHNAALLLIVMYRKKHKEDHLSIYKVFATISEYSIHFIEIYRPHQELS